MPSSQPDKSPDERASDRHLSYWKDAISRAMRGDFGPPGESLRSDIMDELADHLSESMKREERAGRDEAEARERVLKRFGSPSQIAARLWFDGMKGSIMFQRWMMGVSAAALLISIVTASLAIWIIEQNNQSLLEAVEKLNTKIQQQTESTESVQMVTLHFKCMDEKSNKPIKNASLTLRGNLVASSNDELTVNTNLEGLATLGPLRPGNHYFAIASNDHWLFNGMLNVLPGQDEVISVRCPVDVPQMTKVRMSLPTIVSNADRAVLLHLYYSHRVDGREFHLKPEPARIVTASGVFIADDRIDKSPLIDAPDEQMLPIGTYDLHIRFIERSGGWKVGQPLQMNDDAGFYASRNRDILQTWMVAEPGVTNKWILPSVNQLPTQWISKMDESSTN